MPNTGHIILVGTIMGTIARFYLLRIDYRQYPSYPQGYTIHLTLGAIAAGLGAVVIPAILDRQYTAITFLAIAIQQFRDIREIERESLERIEDDELVKRGHAYIEDISKKFESRNYVAMITAISTTAIIYITGRTSFGVVAGIVTLLVMRSFIKNELIGDIAEVRPGHIHFKGPLLMVDDVVITNVGLKKSRERLLERGMAATLIPKDDNARVTLSNIGQRQAILHDVVSILGVCRENDEPEFMPMAKRNSENGYICMIAITMEPDLECMLEVIKRVPVVEVSRKQPLDSYFGRKAAD